MLIHVQLLATQYLLAFDPPNPDPKKPPGKIGEAADIILGGMKWGGLVGGVGAMIAAGTMMAIGRRNRNTMAVEGAIGLPWILLGIAVVMGASSIVGWMA